MADFFKGFVECKGMSYEQASREGERLIERHGWYQSPVLWRKRHWRLRHNTGQFDRRTVFHNEIALQILPTALAFRAGNSDRLGGIGVQ
jgi:hypothetical protein